MLPAEAYDSAKYFRKERDHLFKKNGMALGPLTLPQKAGSFQAIDLFDEPVLLMRDTEERIGLFSRLCRHQFAELVRTDGWADRLICPLHGWTYASDGTFKGLAGRGPSESGNENCDLHPYPLEERNGILHAGLIRMEDRSSWRPLVPTSSPYRFLEARSVGLNWKQIMERGLNAGAILQDLNLLTFADGMAITVLPKFPGSSLVNIAFKSETPNLDELNVFFAPRAPQMDESRLKSFHEQVFLG